MGRGEDAGPSQKRKTSPPLVTTGQMVALVDGLGQGTLNERQRELVHALRSGLLTLGERLQEAEM
ncbi:MAG: hypothetical protein ACE5E7_16005 [Anaerolineae bacterium]